MSVRHGTIMAKIPRRRAFLERVSCRVPHHATPLRPLGIDDEYVRENVDTACQALSFRLVHLVQEDDEGGYTFRIARAGTLLLGGLYEEAAALVDSGQGAKRILAPPPWGVVGSKLRPGGPGMSLKGSGPRAYATQLILAVASGHAVVAGDVVRGNANVPRAIRVPEARERPVPPPPEKGPVAMPFPARIVIPAWSRPAGRPPRS